MRNGKQKERAISGKEPAGLVWRDELLGNAVEVSIGVSRLIDTLRLGPPQTSPPRKRQLPRRSR
jgi:hypothetical protein